MGLLGYGKKLNSLEPATRSTIYGSTVEQTREAKNKREWRTNYEE